MALPIVKVEGNVQWKVRQAQGGNWIAICDPLRLTLQSETYADLMEDIGLALDAMLRDLLESNDLERFLRDHGWKVAGAIPARQAEVRFDVPFYLLPVKSIDISFRSPDGDAAVGAFAGRRRDPQHAPQPRA